MRKPISLSRLLILSAALALTACSSKEPLENAPLAGATIGGEFTLAGKDGKPVRWSDFNGKWRIVYFGYTFCPDACPLDVGVMMKGFKAFEQAEPDLAAKVQPIFITIDPERDTPARLAQFTAAFSPRLVGLSGTAEETARTAKAFAVFYARGKDLPGGYLMDHSRSVILFDPAGKPIAALPVDKGMKDGPAEVAAELEKWVR